MSIHTHVELDSGGVECNPCLANHTSTEPMPSNASPQIPEEQRNASGIEIVLQIEPLSPGRVLEVYTLEDAPAPKTGKQPVISSPNAADTHSVPPQGGLFAKGTHSKEPQDDATGKTRYHRRYSPQLSYKQMSMIKMEPNSVLVPLFEKTLSTSDADPKNGRLVIPKSCAMEHLPELSQPEGFFITIQDANGDDWEFRYRFWPNNNSTMYVMEGTRDYFIKHQCEPGDKVTFYRREPSGKLVMGVTKAAATSGTSSEAAKASTSAPNASKSTAKASKSAAKASTSAAKASTSAAKASTSAAKASKSAAKASKSAAKASKPS